MSYTPPLNQTIYYEQVWAIVRQIPHARVTTYGQIAKLIPNPDDISQEDYAACSSRWVGLAMAACPDDVPWHRVINSQGKISHRPEAGEQKHRLENEGVLFFNGKLDLNEYLWQGPGVSNEPRQGRLF